MGRRGALAMVVGTAGCLIAASHGPAAPEASGNGARAERGVADPRFRVIRPARDIEVVLWARRQDPIGPAGRSPLGTGTPVPLCQAIKGNRGQPVAARGCGLPLLRRGPVQKTGTTITVGARPPRSALSPAQLKAFAARIDGAFDREWATFFRRARQGVPAIDAAARARAKQLAEAIRRDEALRALAEQLRRADKSNLADLLDRYRTLVRQYTTWLPGLRRTFVDLAAIRSIHEVRKPLPSAVEFTLGSPTMTTTSTDGEGDDWETSDELELLLAPSAGTQVSAHAKAGFNSTAEYKRKKYWPGFSVPAGAREVEVVVDYYRGADSRLDDCFGFAYGSASTDISVYRYHGDGAAHPPVAWSRTWDPADALSDATTCGFTGVPVPDPPQLSARAPLILRFSPPASGAEYFFVATARAYADVNGGGTAVVEQHLTINSVVVRYER